MSRLKRRDFLKFTGSAIMAYSLPISLKANENFSDYKALVVVELAGGNDALNMFIPADNRSNIYTGYQAYSNNRSTELTIKDVDLSNSLGNNSKLTISEADANPYYSNNSIAEAYIKGFYLHKGVFQEKIATNALMPEVAHLLNQGKGAIVLNCGNIIKKASKSELKSDRSLVPTAYASHKDASHYVATGQSSLTTMSTGWLGRLADIWEDVNNSNIYKMNTNLSIYGNSKMLFSNREKTFTISYKGPIQFANMDKATIKNVYKNIMDLPRRDLFKRLYNSKRKEAFLQVETTLADWENVTGDNDPFASLTNAYSKPLFDIPTSQELGVNQRVYTHYIRYFEAAARLIAIAQNRNLKRQVIFIKLGGWDTHTNQALYHSRNIRGLSMGIGAFQTAIDSLGLSNNVTLFTVSEFARTSVNNKTGTDHGWGASQLVIGGAVKPGLYGEFPDLRAGGDDDYSLKGRIIPTISFTQYFSTLAQWFGANYTTLNMILPELQNFKEHDLGFMKG